MKILKNNAWTIFSLVIIALLALSGDAMAQNSGLTYSNTIEGVAMEKATNVFTAARNVMFVVGGFGLIAIAFLAITGKMNWKWVGQLAIGLGIIAAASAVINYAVTDDGTTKKVDYGDTLGENN